VTTVQVPVRIRLDLDGDQPDPALVALVVAATRKATTRALRRVGGRRLRLVRAGPGRERAVHR
jgi:hypothetical protein